jgi:integrase/recombinase XerD
MPQTDLTLSQALPGFVEYMTSERRLRPKTIKNYLQSISLFTKQIGDLRIPDVSLQHVVSFKAGMTLRHVGESHIAGSINALKCLLQYCRDILSLPVLDPTRVRAPRVPRRDVTYLTPEELEKLLASIPLRTWAGKPRLPGYCLRALVETLAATGMRISEALSLDRNSIDYQKKEAVIVGKGNRARVVYFTDRALNSITRHLDLRDDSESALFVTSKKKRLDANSAQAMFRRARKWAGLDKRVTPHVIRHTTATNLLRGGCPIGYIKEILGHAQLETTCRYYLGVLNQADTKRAHERYSRFVIPDQGGWSPPANGLGQRDSHSQPGPASAFLPERRL